MYRSWDSASLLGLLRYEIVNDLLSEDEEREMWDEVLRRMRGPERFISDELRLSDECLARERRILFEDDDDDCPGA